MKNFFLFAITAIAVLGLNSCQNDDATADSSFAIKASGADYNAASLLPVQVVSGDITSDVTWTNDKVWVLSGVVRVKNNATLTINPGTFIKADPSITSGANGVLVITKTGRINAVGTAQAPIVFTSYKLLDGNDTTTALPGDFGGVVLLGDAQVNTGSVTNIIEGLGDQPNPEDFYFGGSNNGHTAGSLKYVRIEFAGRVLPTEGENGVEINGLTFGAVGSGTLVDYIQVSYGLDDSYEWFGGTVNAGHLIAFAQDDDGFDFDWGYTGTIERAIAVANWKSTHSTSSGSPDSNGIELDNNAGGTTVTPRTRPTVNYLSVFGVSSASDANVFENAIHVRRAGRIGLNHSTVSGYNRGIFLDGATTAGTFDNVGAHAFVTPTQSPSALTGIVATSTSNPAEKWGTTQPFYGPLDFTTGSRTNGAFATGDSAWIGSWAKFVDFETIYE